MADNNQGANELPDYGNTYFAPPSPKLKPYNPSDYSTDLPTIPDQPQSGSEVIPFDEFLHKNFQNAPFAKDKAIQEMYKTHPSDWMDAQLYNEGIDAYAHGPIKEHMAHQNPHLKERDLENAANLQAEALRRQYFDSYTDLHSRLDKLKPSAADLANRAQPDNSNFVDQAVSVPQDLAAGVVAGVPQAIGSLGRLATLSNPLTAANSILNTAGVGEGIHNAIKSIPYVGQGIDAGLNPAASFEPVNQALENASDYIGNKLSSKIHQQGAQALQEAAAKDANDPSLTAGKKFINGLTRTITTPSQWAYSLGQLAPSLLAGGPAASLAESAIIKTAGKALASSAGGIAAKTAALQAPLAAGTVNSISHQVYQDTLNNPDNKDLSNEDKIQKALKAAVDVADSPLAKIAFLSTLAPIGSARSLVGGATGTAKTLARNVLGQTLQGGGVSAASQAAKNVAEGQPIGENVAEATGAGIGSAVPLALGMEGTAHLLNRVGGNRTPTVEPTTPTETSQGNVKPVGPTVNKDSQANANDIVANTLGNEPNNVAPEENNSSFDNLAQKAQEPENVSAMRKLLEDPTTPDSVKQTLQEHLATLEPQSDKTPLPVRKEEPLPDELSGYAPKRGFNTINFTSDLDKALYAVKTLKSTFPKDILPFMEYLRRQFPSKSDADIQELGNEVTKAVSTAKPVQGVINIDPVDGLRKLLRKKKADIIGEDIPEEDVSRETSFEKHYAQATNPRTGKLERSLIIPRDNGGKDQALLNLRINDLKNNTDKMKKAMAFFPGESPEQVFDHSKHISRNIQDQHARDVVAGTHKENIAIADVADRPKRPITFSESQKETSGITPKVARHSIDEIAGKVGRHIDIRNSSEEHPEGTEALFGNRTEGYYDPKTGRVTLFHDRIASPERAKFVAWHELTHRGFDVKYKGEYDGILDKLGTNETVSKLSDAIAKDRHIETNTVEGKRQAIHEAAAELGSADATGDFNELKTRYGVDVTPQKESTWQGLVRKLGDLFRKVIGSDKLSDEDVWNTIRDVRKEGSDTEGGHSGQGEPIASEQSNGEDNKTRWAKEAKLVPEAEKARDIIGDKWRNKEISTAKYREAIKSIADKYGLEKYDPKIDYNGSNQGKAARKKVEPTLEALDKRAAEIKAQQEAIIKLSQENRGIRGLGRQAVRNPLEFAKNVTTFMQLSYLGTLLKLASATIQATILNPIEAVVGQALRIIPGVGRIAKLAPIEGGGRISTELNTLGKFISTIKEAIGKTAVSGKNSADQYRAAYEALKELQGTIDEIKLTNKDEANDPLISNGLLDIPRNIHKALKTPTQVSTFYRALQYNMQHYMEVAQKNGATPAEALAYINKPEMQVFMQGRSYAKSLEAILLQDSKLHSMIENWLRESHNYKSGDVQGMFLSVVGHLLDFAVRIRKVPINFVATSTSYAFGLVKALAKLYSLSEEGKKLGLDPFARIRHLEGMSNIAEQAEAADYIMKNLKKQTIGVPMLAIGYLAATSIYGFAFGNGNYLKSRGYRQRGDEKRRGEPGDQEAILNGTTIPKHLMHSPVDTLFQIGATIARTEQAESERNGFSGRTNGVINGVLGMMENVPFINLIGELHDIKAAKNRTEALQNFLGREVRSHIIPGFVQELAKYQDNDTERQPKEFLQQVAMGIPGNTPLSRNTVPKRRK